MGGRPTCSQPAPADWRDASIRTGRDTPRVHHAVGVPANIEVANAGPVTVVAIDRPERRNAVDRPTADALLDAFRRFDADPSSAVAVLTGNGGTFCAGSGPEGDRDRAGQPGHRGGSGADGPDPDGPLQAGDRRGRGIRSRGRSRARHLVRPASARRRRGARRLLPPLRRPARRRWHRAPPPASSDTEGPSISSSPAERWARRRRSPSASPTGWSRRATALEAAVEWGRELAALPQDCLRNDRLSALGQWGLSEEDALALEYRYGIASLSSGEAVCRCTRFAEGAGRSGATLEPPAAGTSA